MDLSNLHKHPDTVVVQGQKTEANPSGHLIINKDDFNPEIHTLAEDEEPAKEPESPEPPAPMQPAAPTDPEQPADPDAPKAPWENQ